MFKAYEIKDIATNLGIDTVGITRAEPVKDVNRFISRMNKSYLTNMDYLAKYQSERLNPKLLIENAQSIISVGLNYRPSDKDMEKKKIPYKVAKYAWNNDYHDILREILKKLRNHLTKIEPSLKGKICVDTAPFMDTYWAEQAGLGWRGKHSVLVSKKYGCYLNIGALIIDKSFDNYDKPHSNHCGKCIACINACPTQALIAPYELDAFKCISYWTIESKAKNIPDEIRRNLQNWVFGCDICIDVCPFNRFNKKSNDRIISRRDDIAMIETGEIKNISLEKFNRMFSKSSFMRPGFDGIGRNITAATSI
jgi:epoxyqueuosine reductase